MISSLNIFIAKKNEYYYYFILCPFCNKKIFYKKINENANFPLNGMNGINIKCPYKGSRKYFYFTICPKCKRHQKIQKEIKEGEIIKCLNEKDCNYEFLQIRCQIADCKDITYFFKPKNY